MFSRRTTRIGHGPSRTAGEPSPQGFVPPNSKHPYKPTADIELPVTGGSMFIDFLQAGCSDRIARNAGAVVRQGARCCAECRKWSEGKVGPAEECSECNTPGQWLEVRIAVPAPVMETDCLAFTRVETYNDDRECPDYDASESELHLKKLNVDNYMATPRNLLGLAMAELVPGEFKHYAYDPRQEGLGGDSDTAREMAEYARSVEQYMSLKTTKVERGIGGHPYAYDLHVARHLRGQLEGRETALVYTVKDSSALFRRVPAEFQRRGILQCLLTIEENGLPAPVRSRYFIQAEYWSRDGPPHTYVAPLVDEEVWRSWTLEWETEYGVYFDHDEDLVHKSDMLAFIRGEPKDMDELDKLQFDSLQQ